MRWLPITDPRSFFIPVLVALLIQGAILLLMSTHWMDTEQQQVRKVPSHIAARVVQVEKPKPKLKPKPPAKKKEKPKPKSKKVAKKTAKPNAEPKVKELPAKNAAKSQPKPKPKPKPSITEAQKAAALAELEEELMAEESLQNELNAEKEQAAVTDVSSQIRGLIERVWRYPPSAKHTDTVVVRLYLVPTGEVTEVQVVQSSGNEALDRSAEQAVWKVGTFPVPKDPIIFERNFRRFKLELTPETARL